MKTHPIHLYQNKPGASNSSTSEAWQLCGFLTSAPFYFPASLSCTPLLPLLCGLLITPVSPRAVSPLSQSSPVTHHLVLYLLFSLPTPLLGEAPETRQWLLPTTAHPVFTAVAVYPSADSSHHEGDKKNNLTLTEVPLFLYTLCIPDHLCVGFVVIECKLVGSTHLSLMQQKERAWIFLPVQQLGLRSPWQWHFIPFECSLLRYTFP